MQNVPEIVRRRLEAATPSADHSSGSHLSDNHPDANALTAFAERSLGQDERALVLEHLGRCSDCRDIVALALPAMEPVEPALRPAATGWLTWPALRWGFVAAGIVAITALGVVEYQRRTATTASPARARVEVAGGESSQAKDQSLASPFYSATTKKAANIQAPAPYALTDAAGATLSEKKSTLRAVEPRATVPQPQTGSPHATVVGGSLTNGPRMPNQWQQQSAVQNQAAEATSSSPCAGGSRDRSGRESIVPTRHPGAESGRKPDRRASSHSPACRVAAIGRGLHFGSGRQSQTGRDLVGREEWRCRKQGRNAGRTPGVRRPSVGFVRPRPPLDHQLDGRSRAISRSRHYLASCKLERESHVLHGCDECAESRKHFPS